MAIKLICFDLDGTLVNREDSQPLPHVCKFFMDHGGETKYAICTNQGGVGLRYWMEKGNFGDPKKYPSEGEVFSHIHDSIENCLMPPHTCFYVCFAYLTRAGNWGLVPEEYSAEPEWQRGNRKSAPGMLLMAMQDAKASNEETLMVGDSPDDEQAAKNAGVAFQWAKDFFARDE